MSKQDRLISHTVSQEAMQTSLEKIKQRIKIAGDSESATVEEQLKLVDKLAAFDFGRFLLHNQGLNGYWTDYMLTYPWRKKENQVPQTELEFFLLDCAPLLLATQQRFQIFLKENQKQVKNGATLACVPCGLMGELLYLDYKSIDDIKLVGIDLDSDSIKAARGLAKEKQLSDYVEFIETDAWKMQQANAYDLISSNGLNIYEPDKNKVIELYRCYYEALKPHGKLVTSYLTPPPFLTDHCEWQMDKIDQEDLLLQKVIFVDVMNVKWQCYTSTEETKAQLASVGFKDIEIFFDEAHLFPTVVAVSPS